jgi:type I restriction enzyme, R subunit
MTGVPEPYRYIFRILYRGGTIAGNILFGLAFLIVARGVVSLKVKDYLTITAIGFTLVGISLSTSAMRTAMPNAVFFAFSGTPIDKKNRSTYKVFGPLLDKYTFEESKEDGATLQILYEDRMPELFVEGADTIDQIFERVFADLDKETKDKLKKQYVTKEKIAEAPERIKTICENLVEHYTTHIKPNGYKAMIVATSREAAVTYKKYLDRIGAPKSKIIMTSHLGEKGKDGSSWDEYFLTSDQREEESDHFKDLHDSTQILIVVDMLLVGYDVPIVQVVFRLLFSSSAGQWKANRISRIAS